jgi:hypothetical protein
VAPLSQLENVELNSLLNLAEHNARVSGLVHPDFKQLSRAQQYDLLRQKSGADMFVCLKNIFAKESLEPRCHEHVDLRDDRREGDEDGAE